MTSASAVLLELGSIPRTFDRNSSSNAVFKFTSMNKAVALIFAAGVLFLAGCDKPPSTHVTDWGVVELSAGIPKHLNLDGKDCALTATPIADGKLAILIETRVDADGKNTPGVPPGTPARLTVNTIVPRDVEIVSSVGPKLVRFTLKLK
jgi:hypothetical protein